MELDNTNGDGHSGHFEKRTISAAGAPPAAPPGAINSPFAMARQFADQAGINLDQVDVDPPRRAAKNLQEGSKLEPTEIGRAGSLMARARQTLAACGPLTPEQLAQGLGATIDKVNTLIRNGITKKAFKRGLAKDGTKVIELSAPPPRPTTNLHPG